MAKKSKVSVDDFAFYDEEEQQPLNIIAKNIQKTDNKEITNGYQTDNNAQKEQATNGYQTDNKQITKKLGQAETDSKQVTKRITKEITIGKQRDNKQITKCSFESLVGNEKNLLLLIFKECLRVGSLISPEITLSHINESLEISPGVAKVVIHRLVKKGVIKRETSKTGRGGWIKFSIDKELYQDLRIRETDNKQITNGYQTDNKEVTKRITERITNPSYSSSTELINITSKTIELPENLRRFGISTVNLQSLITSGKTTQEIVERSLSALSYDVAQGKTGNLANILFGVLGSGREYISVSYTQTIHDELEQELKRMERAQEASKKLKETQLKAKYLEFIQANPSFINEVRAKNTMIQDPNILESIAFAQFCEQESNFYKA